MALTLGQAETKLRAFTQHKVDTRLSQPEAWEYLNDGYRWARQQLQLIAPSLYLSTSSEITFDDIDPGDSENEIVLSDDDVNFDHISHVERKAPDGVRFYAIERTNPAASSAVRRSTIGTSTASSSRSTAYSSSDSARWIFSPARERSRMRGSRCV